MQSRIGASAGVNGRVFCLVFLAHGLAMVLIFYIVLAYYCGTEISKNLGNLITVP